MDALFLAIAGGVVQGLITWGALRVELRYLRRDTDANTARLNAMDQRQLARAIAIAAD